MASVKVDIAAPALRLEWTGSARCWKTWLLSEHAGCHHPAGPEAGVRVTLPLWLLPVAIKHPNTTADT